MRMSKDEIREQIVHKKAIIRALTARQRPLELQAAQKGLNTDPATLTEITSLTDQIRIHEDEISKLETLASEDQLSFAEVEYRVLLAEMWDTPIGRPTVAGATRLEQVRLQMGIAPERAQILENEIRIALTEEVFLKLDIRPLINQPTYNEYLNTGASINISISGENERAVYVENMVINQTAVVSNPVESALQLIGKAIRLDHTTALQLFLQLLPPEAPLDKMIFEQLLFTANRVWVYKDEQSLFKQFTDKLATRESNLLLSDSLSTQQPPNNPM